MTRRLHPFAIAWIVVAGGLGLATLWYPQVGDQLALAPSRVWQHGEVWRLVTWAFAWPRIAELAVCAVGVAQNGSKLADKIGAARMLALVLAAAVAGGVAMCLLGLVWSRAWHLELLGNYSSLWVVSIAAMRMFPTERYVPRGFPGAELEARHVVWLAIGTAVLLGLALGITRYLPTLVAVGVAVIFPLPAP